MFEKCSCTVAIGGDIRSVVPKTMVTPAEIKLLQSIHGDDAVTNIRVDGMFVVTAEEERDRLGNFYGDQKVINLFNQYGDLPDTLEAARIPSELLDPTFTPEPKKPAKKKTTRKRARDAKGHYIADDPDTPENEAYVKE
ncbi:MAG: hypothetical protein CL942_16405 [Desulfovibrio sp.]|nr:hypothetical protein [Desulfovibrio sp.]MBC18620.1 hypothetical protein [Desulfovibrio sp.]|tara:strand:+ start:7984 stop:8400 length:417 start_codon:yes stop_codon:yes gene_type:complete